jgi:hypothetical protein
MKKYPKQWVFGADDTGDFTITENQRWYRQYVKEFGKIDLITLQYDGINYLGAWAVNFG